MSVGVAARAAMSRKVFLAGQHAALAVRADERRRVTRNHAGIRGETPPLAVDDRVVGVGVEIDHRR